ncbi:hypothetical protein D3C81_1138680 [compost metagenome]
MRQYLHAPAQVGQVKRAHILPTRRVTADQHGAALHVGQARQQAGQQALAGACGTHQCHHLAGLQGQRAVVQDVAFTRWRADAHLGQFQPQRPWRQGRLAANNRRPLVQQLPDALGTGAGIGEGLHDPADAFDTEHHCGRDQQRSDQLTDAQRARCHAMGAVHQDPHMPQRDYRLGQRDARAGIGQGRAGVAGEHADLAGETFDALALQAERLDHPHATDAFGQILADLVVGGAHGAIKRDQAIGLHHEQPQPGPGQQQRDQTEQGVVPAQQPHGGHHHQGRFDDLPPEGDQRIAHLVGIAGGAGDQFTHAMAPVVAQVQALDLDEDAFAQARQ